MALHKALLEPLPPADVVEASYAGLHETLKDADGFYILAQYIAEQYGEKAYDIAEKVFSEMGMRYDPQLLRTPDGVRRVGYGFDGINVYNVAVRPYAPADLPDVVRIYNNVYRTLSDDCLMDAGYFHEKIAGSLNGPGDGLLVAKNEAGTPVGFIHCSVDAPLKKGFIEAMCYYGGRIHAVTGRELAEAAVRFFRDGGALSVALPGETSAYPFAYALGATAIDEIEKKLVHIYNCMKTIRI